jgi:hypothetical protein
MAVLHRFNQATKAWIAAFATIFVLVFAAASVEGQVAGGAIVGMVHDQTNALVAHARVSTQNRETGVILQTETSADGLFTIPNLQPAIYNVKVSVPGFRDSELDGVIVAVGEQKVINFKLAVASSTQTIQVGASAAQVELASAGVQQQVDQSTLEQLPLNGRDWTQLAALQPGVNTVRSQATVGSNGSSDATKVTRGFGTQLSVSGTRSAQNNYRQDGISFNDYTNDAPGNVLGAQLGVDAIQEFSVLTTNYSAEYGKTSGGVINSVTRSGTNALHGSAYEFARNATLDARNYFDGTNKPPFSRNQFGGTLGGPIRHNKSFFFGNYEGLRQALTVTQISSVPSDNARKGILSTGTITVDDNITPVLAFYHSPNAGLDSTGDIGYYSVATKQNGTEDFYLTKLDHLFSEQDRITGTFLLDKSDLSQPDQLNNILFHHKLKRPFVAIEETHTFSPTLINSLRFGFNRNYADLTADDAINVLANDTSLGSVPDRPAAKITVPGLATFSGGAGAFANFTFGWNSFQAYDDAFLIHGKHALRAGFALERMQSNNLFHFSENGGFSFDSLTDFLTNQPHRFSATLASTATTRGLRETLLAGYIQDDWHAIPRLTFNLGLRYEFTTVPTEVNGKIATLLTPTSSTAHVGDPYFSNPTLKNFEPRIGFAYDLFGDGKTALRGGYGIFDVLPLPYQFLRLASAGAPYNITLAASGLPQGAFPHTAYDLALANYDPTTLAGERTVWVEQKPPRSYVQQWHLQIQRELTASTTLTVGYVGSRGIHLPYATDDINIVMPTKVNGSYYWPTSSSATLLNPAVGQLDALTYNANSHYHGLQAGVRVIPAHGLRLQGSYTWQKSIDDGSSTLAGDQYLNSASSVPLWFDSATRRGLSDFNLGQNGVVSAVWSIPNAKQIASPARWLLNNWELGGIFQASTGAPFSVFLGGDPLGLGSTDPWAYPDRIHNSSCKSTVNPGNALHYIKTGCFEFPSDSKRLGNSGRNTLTGPGYTTLDGSLYKNVSLSRVSERFNAQFRAELFNVLNHANFAPPLDNDYVFNKDGSPIGDAGKITSTQGSSRQIQFGLKVQF